MHVNSSQYICVYCASTCNTEHITVICIYICVIHTLHTEVQRLIMEYLCILYNVYSVYIYMCAMHRFVVFSGQTLPSVGRKNRKHMGRSGIHLSVYSNATTTTTHELAYQLPTIATTALSIGINFKMILNEYLNIMSYVCISVYHCNSKPRQI